MAETRAPARLIGFYICSIGSIGCVPYVALLLGEAGLPDTMVAVAMVAFPVGVLGGGPLWAWVADRTGAPHLVLRVATALSVVAGGLLALTRDGWGMAAALLLWSVVRAPQLPLADGITVRLLGGNSRSYGQIRAWGSGAFLVVAWLGGAMREVWPRSPLFLSWAMLAGAALIAWSLPAVEAPHRTIGPSRLPQLVRALGPFLLVSILHGIGLVCFDSFWSLHAERLGLASWMAGTGVALAVAVEIGVMLMGRRLLDGFGPERLIAVAIGVGIPHWLLTASVTDPFLLVAVQALRGVAFGAFWISGVALLSERAPTGLGTSAQALLPATAFGFGYLGCMSLAAVVFDYADTSTLFRIMAGLDLLAGVALAAALVSWRRPPRSACSRSDHRG